MIKQTFILLIIAVVVYTAIVFVRTPQKKDDFLNYFKDKVVELSAKPREKVKEFFEEKKEIIEEEIEKEKQQGVEEAREVGKSLWEKIGDFIFRRGGN